MRYRRGQIKICNDKPDTVRGICKTQDTVLRQSDNIGIYPLAQV
jgi:hypothetical protein